MPHGAAFPRSIVQAIASTPQEYPSFAPRCRSRWLRGTPYNLIAVTSHRWARAASYSIGCSPSPGSRQILARDWPGDELMTCSISAVAVCCSCASFKARFSRATSVSCPAPLILDLRRTDGALRPPQSIVRAWIHSYYPFGAPGGRTSESGGPARRDAASK